MPTAPISEVRTFSHLVRVNGTKPTRIFKGARGLTYLVLNQHSNRSKMRRTQTAPQTLYYAFVFLSLMLTSTSTPLPYTFDPSSPHFKLQQCRCDGWDGGPNKAACYLTPWSSDMPPSWTGALDQWICATYNKDSIKPDNDMWYECRTARGIRDPDAKMCEACAQSGSGATGLCRGKSACYRKGAHGGADVQRCDDAGTCPLVSENDGNCWRQWWECGSSPSEPPQCTPNWTNFELQFSAG